MAGAHHARQGLQALDRSLPEVRGLLHEARSRDGRDLGLVTSTGLRRFRRFRPDEVDAIWAYLQTLPPVPPSGT
ncbi:MAG: hypothetical protein ACT4P7_06320 [Gemmatimonadaceae bacterium]